MKTTNNTDKVSTLIITVGTRQIGWHCKDIRKKRNKIIHDGESVNATQVGYLWANKNFSGVKIPTSSENIMHLMMNVLKEISPPPNLNNLLMRSLYQWGLKYLEDVS